MSRSNFKQCREVEIRRLAQEAALTGEHAWFLSIESMLIDMGYPEARRVLDNHVIREQLDKFCDQATKRNALRHGEPPCAT